MSKRKDIERDIDSLLMAMVISDLFGDTIMSDNMDEKKIMGLM